MKQSDSADDQVDLFGFTEEERVEKSKRPEVAAPITGARRYKPKADRQQADCIGFQLEDFVSKESIVWSIDMFVDHLDLASLGFKHSSVKLSAGQPPYDPACLLRLYLYGYQRQVRSGRRLARECRLNVEVMWLMRGQTPQYRTINSFRAENSEALVRVHSEFKMLCWQAGLMGGERISVDGSHFRGNVSANSFQSQESLNKTLEMAQELVKRWQQSLEEQEQIEAQEDHPDDEPVVDPDLLKSLLERAKQREADVTQRLEQLEASGTNKQSYTDPDARLLNKRGNKTQGYNVQIAVDHRHYLIIGDAVTKDVNDLKQLLPVAKAVKESFELDKLEVLADKGYYSSMAITGCLNHGITPYVPVPATRTLKDGDKRYTRYQFRYDEEQNVMWCPAGEPLRPNGNIVAEPGQAPRQRFRNKGACAHCEQKRSCLTEKGKYRDIWRLIEQPVLDVHAERMKANAQIYDERKCAVEHPFGTLKSRAGWSHFMVRGMDKVRGEWSLMALCYNFTRVLNLLGYERFTRLCRDMADRRSATLTRPLKRALAAIMRRFNESKNGVAIYRAKCHANFMAPMAM